MEQTSQIRIQWIDTAKLLGIYLVILGHISLTNQLVTNIIYSFHMPLFFFLSGLTARKDKIINAFEKNVKVLIIPYVCFYLIHYVKSFIRNPEWFENDWIKPLMGMFVGVSFDTDISYMAGVPLWFLMGLFCCKMLYTFINNISGKYETIVQIILCIFFVLIAYLLNANKRFLPLSMGAAFLAYPFFLIGNYFASQIISILRKNNLVKQKIIVLLFAIILVILFTLINGKVGISGISFGNNIFLFYITGFIGIIAIIIIASFINLPNILNYFARNTIIILALHGITTRIIVIPLTKFGFAEIAANKAALIPSVTLAIVVAIGSLLLNYIPIYIINKYFPWIIGKKNKNKIVPSNTN